MTLIKKLSTKTSIAILTTCFAIAVPSAASAHYFFWWWLRPASTPVQDVSFQTVTSSRGRIYDVFFLNNAFDSYNKIDLQDLTLSASVASDQLTIPSFTLSDGSATSAVVTVPTIDLVTDILGSSFKSNVTIDVTTSSGSYSLTGKIFGRITERNGSYILRANIGGLSMEDLGSGSIAYHLLRTTLSGTTSVP